MKDIKLKMESLTCKAKDIIENATIASQLATKLFDMGDAGIKVLEQAARDHGVPERIIQRAKATGRKIDRVHSLALILSGFMTPYGVIRLLRSKRKEAEEKRDKSR